VFVHVSRSERCADGKWLCIAVGCGVICYCYCLYVRVMYGRMMGCFHMYVRCSAYLIVRGCVVCIDSNNQLHCPSIKRVKALQMDKSQRLSLGA
jgi:hypothetical protein